MLMKFPLNVVICVGFGSVMDVIFIGFWYSESMTFFRIAKIKKQ